MSSGLLVCWVTPPALLIGFYTLQDYVRIKRAEQDPDEYYKKLCPHTYKHIYGNQQKEDNKAEGNQVD